MPRPDAGGRRLSPADVVFYAIAAIVLLFWLALEGGLSR